MRWLRSQGRYDGGMGRLNFDAPVEELQEDVAAPESVDRPVVAGTGALFGEDEEIPPTWTEGGDVYHVTEKCTRLRAIRKARRVQSKAEELRTNSVCTKRLLNAGCAASAAGGVSSTSA